VVILALITIALVLVSVPPVARLPREYYQGKDQFEWAALLQSGDLPDRDQAITALCEILKENQNHPSVSVYGVALSALIEAKAKNALRTLTNLLDTVDSRWNAEVKHAIELIELAK
jgi:hypothetical protein